jgi:hypothetical protein
MKMPHHPFYLFGMGNRRKFLYKGGTLYDAVTGEILRSWTPIHEQIIPHDYMVKWQTRDGRLYSLEEDEEGVSLKVEGTRTFLTQGPLHLPDFKDNPHAHVLRILLHEVLINVVEGKPLGNFFTQARPTYRDAAVICEVLRKTDNLPLVRDWILGMEDPFDAAGPDKEPDNLGEALFMLSMVADAGHPLVARLVEAARAFQKTDYIEGRTEGMEHPVFQTKWLKFGLKSLGLDDPYKIPVTFDPYSSVFWLDYRDVPSNGPPFPEKVKDATPHLAWAEAHFHGWDPPMPLPAKAYPLSWELQSQPPQGMKMISADYVEKKIVAPHARHAAEMLLYFLEALPEAELAKPDRSVLQAR